MYTNIHHTLIVDACISPVEEPVNNTKMQAQACIRPPLLPFGGAFRTKSNRQGSYLVKWHMMDYFVLRAGVVVQS